LKSEFGFKVISRRFPERNGGKGLVWHSKSPDLSVLDFFVWGRTNDDVYRAKPKTLSELEARIESSLTCIPAESCRRAFQSFESRLRIMAAGDGEQVELALGKK